MAAALYALCASVASPIGGAVDGYPEDSVKAAFVLRFAGYVTWPEDALPPGRFTIAVLGDSDLAVNMQRLVKGRPLLGRRVEVRRIASIRDAAEAQILYVGRDRRGRLQELLAPLAKRHLLIITDESDGLAEGGMINLLVADQRVRFEISRAAARAAGLSISSDLLALAVRVRE